MQGYLIPAGHTGLGISCISYVDNFKIACVADDSIMKDPQILVDFIEENLRSIITEGLDKAMCSVAKEWLSLLKLSVKSLFKHDARPFQGRERPQRPNYHQTQSWSIWVKIEESWL